MPWQENEFSVITNKTGGTMVIVNVEKIKDWSKVPGVKQCIEVPLADGETKPCMAFMSAMKDIDGDGKVNDFAGPALDAGYLVTSSYAANAIPVAEYCVANLILALKRFLPHTRQSHTEGRSIWREPLTGAFGSTVGLVSLGMVGRHVLHLLRSYDVKIAAHCITLTEERARELGIRRCTLEEVFAISDALSIHTALKPETRGMITGAHIASMKQGATLINAARGAVIRENEMIDVLRRRPDLTAVLDVSDPEPAPSGSPLYRLDNVFLTPHTAGSLHGECRRLGHYVFQELCNYLEGKPPVYSVTRDMLVTMA